MHAADLVRYSAGGLRGHRLRTVLSILGVAIGVASVILLTSLGEGARLYVAGQFSSLGTHLVILFPGKTETFGNAPMVSTAVHDLTVEDIEALPKSIPQIDLVAPLSLGTAKTTFGDRSRDCIVLGTTHDLLQIRQLKMQIGRFLPAEESDAPLCVLGAQVRSQLLGTMNPLGEMIRIGDTRFRVIGVLATRGTSIGTNMDEVIWVPVHTAMRMYNRSSVFRAMVGVRRSADLEKVKEACVRILKQRHDGQEDVTVITQDAVLSTFGKILGILTAALVGIAAVSLTVAGIGIMNVMLVSVSERVREIGLLKAVGVTSQQIVLVFLFEAAAISTLGGVIGLVFGLAAGRIFRLIYPEFPVQPPFWAVLWALIISISVGLLFGSLPARRASRLDPVAALMRRRA